MNIELRMKVKRTAKYIKKSRYVKESPEFLVGCVGDVCFWQPGAMASKMDKVDGIGDGGVMHGIVRAVDEAVYAWYGGAMGGREVYNDP